MTSNTPTRVDVAVVGGGIAGLATALALRLSPGGPRATVAVCDPRFMAGAVPPPRTLRAVAIAPAARRFLASLDVWAPLAGDAQPIQRMTLGDTRPGDVPAPTFLAFDGREVDDVPLAHMVFQDDLHTVLARACRAAGVTIQGVTAPRVVPAPGALDLPDAALRARLVVAADGGESRLRAAAGLRTIGRDYGQSAVVATLSHSRDHRGEALQHFLPGGPLAFLPLRSLDGTGHRSSIVWTERRDVAAALLQLSPEAFCAALEERGGHERGALRLEDQPRAYPLAVRLAVTMTADRLALAGDAARTVHPLAGQGLNLGLGDAEALAAQVGGALALGLDPGGSRVLDGYTRARRADQLAVAAATDGLNRLFSNDSAPLRAIRDIGLGLVDRAPGLKRAIIRRAAGLG